MTQMITWPISSSRSTVHMLGLSTNRLCSALVRSSLQTTWDKLSTMRYCPLSHYAGDRITKIGHEIRRFSSTFTRWHQQSFPCLHGFWVFCFKCFSLYLDVCQLLTILKRLIQVAQLSQRDRAAGWVSYCQKWKTGTGRQYLRTIQVNYSTTATYLASKEIEIGEKTLIRAITPFKVIQGHRGRYQSKARMRLPISD